MKTQTTHYSSFFAFLLSLVLLIGVPVYVGIKYGLSNGLFTALSLLCWLFILTIVLFVLLMFFILDITGSWVMTRTANKMDKYLNPRVFNAVFERSVFLPGGGQ